MTTWVPEYLDADPYIEARWCDLQTREPRYGETDAERNPLFRVFPLHRHPNVRSVVSTVRGFPFKSSLAIPSRIQSPAVAVAPLLLLRLVRLPPRHAGVRGGWLRVR